MFAIFKIFLTFSFLLWSLALSSELGRVSLSG